MSAQLQNTIVFDQAWKAEFANLATMKSNFENLKVWELSVQLVKSIYQLSDDGFERRDWDLTKQVRRASISIISNIAEGSERDNPKEFVRFLTYAKGSCGEVRAQLIVAKELDFISQGCFEKLDTKCKTISRMLFRLMEHLKQKNNN